MALFSALAVSEDFSYAPDLLTITREAFVTAKAAVSHSIDGLVNGSKPAFQAVKECEERLDSFDRELDQRLAPAITQVNAAQARVLLACMKLMIDLERAGDLVAAFAERSAIVRTRIDMQDLDYLTRMACVLENMLTQAQQAFAERNVDLALKVLRADTEMDRFRNLLLVRHTDSPDGLQGQEACTFYRWQQPWSAPAITPRTWPRKCVIWSRARVFVTCSSPRTSRLNNFIWIGWRSRATASLAACGISPDFNRELTPR